MYNSINLIYLKKITRNKQNKSKLHSLLLPYFYVAQPEVDAAQCKSYSRNTWDLTKPSEAQIINNL